MAKQQFLSKIYTSRSPGTKPKTIQGRNSILYLFFSFLLSVPMKSDVFCFLAGDANIFLNMNWLAAVTTSTVHTLFTCYPLKNWTPEGRMSDSCSDALHCCLQWMTYFTAACSFVFDPKHRPFTCDAEKVFFLSSRHFFFPECVLVSESLIFTDPQGCWAAEDPVEFMSLQHLHDEIYSLIGRRALTDRGAVFRPVARQFSLIAKCLFYNHITFSSL